jgi:hypothetical protein
LSDKSKRDIEERSETLTFFFSFSLSIQLNFIGSSLAPPKAYERAVQRLRDVLAEQRGAMSPADVRAAEEFIEVAQKDCQKRSVAVVSASADAKVSWARQK